MRNTLRIITVALAVGLGGASAMADQLELVGTLRDFQQSHPDFEFSYTGTLSVVQGIVRPQLGADGAPVLFADTVANTSDPDSTYVYITAQFSNTWVYITSSKDISHVTLVLNDGTNEWEYKYDDLPPNITADTFPVPEDAPEGTVIEGVWVKSGDNTKTKGGGGGGDSSGEFLYLPRDGSDEGVHYVIDPEWHIESPGSFNEWFHNAPGVNQTVPITLVLDNGQNTPGGVYSFQPSVNDEFYPIDDQLFGNEGDSHNSNYTVEIPARFEYTDPSTRSYPLELHISSDDDVWVYIDGQLVIDLGGAHKQTYGSVDVDSIAGVLGLEPGETYDVDIFIVDRHSDTGSNLTIETTIQLLAALYD